jgi:regulator of cell morphogenesis and NO signaling
MTEPASPLPPEAAVRRDWPDLGDLVRHIVDTHHRYVRDAIPAITTGLHRLVNQYAPVHPELHPIRQTFAQLGEELLTHMEKEEHILFPYIDELAAAHERKGPFPASPFGTIANPVRMMEDDHQEALALVATLRDLTHDYTPARDWAGVDAACYAGLARFEADLRQHIDLENTVLFPRALDLEARLT